MKKVIALGLIAAASLGACDRIPGLGTGSPPVRKAGLWEQSLQNERRASPLVTEACFDAASDQRVPIVPRQPRRAGACSKFDLHRQGGDWVVDSTCNFGGGRGGRGGGQGGGGQGGGGGGFSAGATVTSHVVISGDFSSRYTITSTRNIENAPDPSRNGKHTTTLTAVYKGACPADIGPGQVKLPSGDVVDMAQLRRGMFRSNGNGGGGRWGAGQGGGNGASQGGGAGGGQGGAHRGAGGGGGDDSSDQ